jgi:ABC-type transport system substrate-binding protein
MTEGIKFTDGVELTCADAQFMIRTIGTGTDDTGDELRRSPRGKSISRIDTVECADDYTLVITTNGPMPSLPSTLALGYFQLRPKHVYEGNLFEMLSSFGPGIGPFMSTAADYTAGDTLRYTRNPEYWNQPYPYLDGIEQIAGTRTSAYAALRVGRTELGYVPGGAVELEKADGFLTPYQSSTHGGRKFQVNWTREPWNNPNMARAVQCALDGEKFLETGYSGVGIFFQGLWPPGSEWGLSPAEVAAVHPCLDPATSMDERQQIARDLLAGIGFDEDNPARPYIPIWNNCYGESFPSLQEDLQKVNILPDTTQFESGRAYDIAYSGEFDMIPWCFISPRFDPDGWYYEHYYSTSDRNYGKYTNPEVDALIDLQSITIDREERVGYINEAERILLQDSAKIILYHYQNIGFHARWLKDFFQVSPSTGAATHRYTRVWIDQADYAASALE